MNHNGNRRNLATKLSWIAITNMGKVIMNEKKENQNEAIALEAIVNIPDYICSKKASSDGLQDVALGNFSGVSQGRKEQKRGCLRA